MSQLLLSPDYSKFLKSKQLAVESNYLPFKLNSRPPRSTRQSCPPTSRTHGSKPYTRSSQPRTARSAKPPIVRRGATVELPAPLEASPPQFPPITSNGPIRRSPSPEVQLPLPLHPPTQSPASNRSSDPNSSADPCSPPSGLSLLDIQLWAARLPSSPIQHHGRWSPTLPSPPQEASLLYYGERRTSPRLPPPSLPRRMSVSPSASDKRLIKSIQMEA